MVAQSVQRRALEDELRIILEQKAAIEVQLAQLQREEARPSPPAVKASKRPAGATPSKTPAPPSKKQKVDDRQKRVSSLWGQMATMLKQIMKQRDAAHFSQPVDTEKLKVPDYYKIVKVPMDLGTIKSNLENRPEKGQPRHYTSPTQFCKDVRQVWANCRMYNPEGHQVRGMGDRLSDAWEKKWQSSQIEEKWETIMREQKADELGPAMVPHRLKEMSAELQELQGRVTPGRAGTSSPDSPRTFTFEDKRRLSQHLGALPGERLGRVLEIVAETTQLSASGDDEIELDIDALSEDTLIRLEDYVELVMNEAQKKFETGKAAAGTNKGRGEAIAHPSAAVGATEAPTPDAAAANGLPSVPGSSQQLAASAADGRDGVDVAPTQSAQSPAANGPRSTAIAAAGSDGDSPQSKLQASRNSHSSSPTSSDGSIGEVGSKHDSGEVTKGPGIETGAEQSTLVSATHATAPGIYQTKSRKDVTLQNEGAWGALAAAKPSASAAAPGGKAGGTDEGSASPTAAADGSLPTAATAGGGEDEGTGGAATDDPMWSEFERREKQQMKLAQEKKDQDAARLSAKAEAEEAARKELEARQAEAAAEAEAERQQAAAAVAAKAAKVESKRQEELAAVAGAATDLAGPQDIQHPSGGNALNALGLQQHDDTSDSEVAD